MMCSENNISIAKKHLHKAEQARQSNNYLFAIDEINKALLVLTEMEGINAGTMKVDLFFQLGSVYIAQGNWSMAETTLIECLSLSHDLTDSETSAKTLASLGQNAFKAGKLKEARTYLNEAVSLCIENRDEAILSFAHLWLGAVAALEGEVDLAETELLRAVSIAHMTEDFSTEGRARNILGENARLNGKYSEAINHYQEALSIYQSIDQKFGMTMVIHNLGHVKTMMGDTETALIHYDESLRMALDIQAIPAALEILAALAGIAADKGNYEHALNLLGVVFNNPSAPKEALHMFAEPLLIRLQNELSSEDVEMGLSRGRSLGFDKVVNSLLNEKEVRN
jgi:tetratricopeptide (TPR) repeat protein